MAKRGAPSTYSLAMAAEICRRIALGESLRSICGDVGMPNMTTVFDWRARHPAFDQQYTRAREDQADTLAEEILDVARAEPERCTRTSDDGESFSSVDGGSVQNKRVLIDALKWRAAHLRPKVWGDKITQEHTGPGGGPIQVIDGVPDA